MATRAAAPRARPPGQETAWARPGRRLLARLVTEIGAPAPVAAALVLALAVHSADSLASGLRWGAVSALFSCGLPYAYVLAQVRRGRVPDRHVRERRRRPRLMLVALGSMGLGLGVVLLGGAPRPLTALIVSGLVGLVLTLLVTLAWKISVHAATLAGAAAVALLVFGPPLWPALVLTAAVAWARVELGDHSPAQVLAGATLGAFVALAVFRPLQP